VAGQRGDQIVGQEQVDPSCAADEARPNISRGHGRSVSERGYEWMSQSHPGQAPIDVGVEHRDGSGGDARNPGGLTEGRRAYGRQALYDLARQPGNPLEDQVLWNRTAFVPPPARNRIELAPKI